MKRISLALAVLLVASISPASAARPTSLAQCQKTVGSPHAPMTVKQPTKNLTSFPKTFTFTTNCGDIVVSTVGKKAPTTITALAALAKAGYFNSSLCHRLTTEGLFVLQCGDTTFTGSGFPTKWKGYAQENLPKTTGVTYPAGTVAMAHSSQPNSNGSQFFLVYKDSPLPADYTVWGKITKGLDLLVKIGDIGAFKKDEATGNAYYANDGVPIQPVEIKKVTVK